MLIAQVTDCHIGFERDNPDEANTQRLHAVLERLKTGPNRPDLLLLSGDLTEFGDAASYQRLGAMLADFPSPVRVMTGNHDAREALSAAFPDTAVHAGFVQYSHTFPGLRLLALDTLEPGRHGGAFCEARAEWLCARLDSDDQTPVVIAMHHPPIESGIAWLDGDNRDPWITRFAEAISNRPQVRAILCGHLHRTIHSSFHGIPLTVCPSTAATVALDLNSVERDLPDGRAMILGEPAGYALHRWDGARLVSHFEMVPVAGPWPVLARYDPAMLETVRHIASERPV